MEISKTKAIEVAARWENADGKFENRKLIFLFFPSIRVFPLVLKIRD